MKSYDKVQVALDVQYLGEEIAMQELEEQGYTREQAYKIVRECKKKKS
jgi:adenylosuccinate lyase